jgi:opacity protein-like surface antigen
MNTSFTSPAKSLPATLAALLAAATCAAAMPAAAQSAAGPYLSAAVGFNDLGDETISGVGAPFGRQPGGNVRVDNGGVAALTFGYDFGFNLRVELEGSYRRNGVHRVTAGALKEADATGDHNKTSLFVNALYDLPRLAGVTPYVGVGVGHARAKWSELYAFQRDERVHFDDTASSRAYQAILGATLMDTAVPNLALILEYRYLRTRDVTYDGAVQASRFGAFPITADVDRTRDHSLLVGVRYRFNGMR